MTSWKLFSKYGDLREMTCARFFPLDYQQQLVMQRTFEMCV
jgi:hypothetical protein